MDTVVITYITYLLVSVALTTWVGRTLYKNGSHFLVDVFQGNKDLASAVNHLLVVGFYLINFGFVSFSLKIADPPTTAQGAFEALSVKLGAVLITLGILHLTNIFVFNTMRNHARNEQRRMSRPQPPVRPDGSPTYVQHMPPA